MRVYVTHVRHIHSRTLERVQNACRHAGAIGLGFRDVVRVAIGRSAQNLRVDSRAACRRVFRVFENQHSGALPHDEAVSARVPGPRRARGVIVALTQRLTRNESSDACTPPSCHAYCPMEGAIVREVGLAKRLQRYNA